MKKKIVTLGGLPYEIQELPARKNAGWRKELQRRLAPLLEIVEQAGKGVELRNNEDLMAIVGQASQLLVAAPDLLIEMLFLYSPALANDQEAIMGNAYDSELLSSFTAVLGMAYPFESLASLARLASGSIPNTATLTSMSLPSPNGVNSVRSSTP